MAWIRNIAFPELLEELKRYCSKDFYWKTDKAKRVYSLCIDQGHEELAYRIFVAHSVHVPENIQYDSVMAFSLALQASQIANK